jgi:uncharacterized protein YbcV (DUF1398 family)
LTGVTAEYAQQQIKQADLAMYFSETKRQKKSRIRTYILSRKGQEHIALPEVERSCQFEKEHVPLIRKG